VFPRNQLHRQHSVPDSDFAFFTSLLDTGQSPVWVGTVNIGLVFAILVGENALGNSA
jgi:hypothetical protein